MRSYLPIIGVSVVLILAMFSPFVSPAAAGMTAEEYAHANFDVLQNNIKNAKHFGGRIAAEVFNEASLIRKTDKTPIDVILRRTRTLAETLKAMPGGPKLDAELKALAVFDADNQSGKLKDDAKKHFRTIAALRRKIAFKNPLLNFDKIVFLKQNMSTYGHMCDQYFGHKNTPGRGLFIVENVFSDSPVEKPLLKGMKVKGGHLDGKELSGSMISLDVAYDAKQMLFAMSESQRKGWSPEGTFHIFKCDIDPANTAAGIKNLVQLTTGNWNDFDPCFMPSGRVLFISERIGGLGRCHGRRVPTYTLHSMLPNGEDIIPLSYFETNEWHPSIDNNGMIIYTRWDYIDRDTNVAHHIWHTYPDGRDPRSYHGNYPLRRNDRPWMEMSNRAIPGSHKYISVAAGHHDRAYGSLVVIDIRKKDDRKMSQLKRLTPDNPFPEAERGKKMYATPWPLSENFYITLYQPQKKQLGIYLLDAFGNKIFLHDAEGVACLDPIPLVKRSRPPIIPSRTLQAREDIKLAGPPADPKWGIVTVSNVYKAEFPFSKGTKITDLRLINVFPKSTQNADRPRVGIGTQSFARGVLGTVPVEKDGSAHFKVPVGITFYMQALDERGLAIQTMRSATYVHPGETLSCIGCHEEKNTTSGKSSSPTAAIALKRGPSEIKRGVSGSYPLSFIRLVQPVLDKKCVPCHTKEKKAPSLAGSTGTKFSPAYNTLGKYAWTRHGGNGGIRKNKITYSIPGKNGALASKLYTHLTTDAKHKKNAKLTDEEMRRITLWLDGNSVYWGADTELETQAKGLPTKPVWGIPPGFTFKELVR
jgi:hypothetical protein